VTAFFFGFSAHLLSRGVGYVNRGRVTYVWTAVFGLRLGPVFRLIVGRSMSGEGNCYDNAPRELFKT
jgi:hypothetical protein